MKNVKRTSFRIPIEQWRTMTILQSLGLFPETQEFCINSLDKEIKKILKKDTSAKKIVEDSLKHFPAVKKEAKC